MPIVFRSNIFLDKTSKENGLQESCRKWQEKVYNFKSKCTF
jgi:hypothetical protein